MGLELGLKIGYTLGFGPGQRK